MDEKGLCCSVNEFRATASCPLKSLDGKKPYQPHTDFGKAVRESGFSRVCPGCWKKWSNRGIWIQETAGIDGRQRMHNCGGKMRETGIAKEEH